MKTAHRIALPLAALGAVAALVAAHGDVSTAPASIEPVEAAREGPAPRAEAALAVARQAPVGRVVEQSYRLTYDRVVSMGPGQSHMALAGTWTVVPLGPDRLHVSLDLDDYSADTPAPLGLESPFQLGLSDGRLSGIGHLDDVTPAARNLLAELVTALHVTRGEGREWTADEVDLNGAYLARYVTTGAGRGERIRGDYAAAGITAEGMTRFRLDATGVVEVRVAESTARAFDRLELSASAAVDAALVRESARAVKAPRVHRLPLRAIAPVVDPAGLRAADRNRIGDADMQTVRAWLDALDTDLTGTDRQRLRDGVHARLRTFARLHPEALGEYRDTLRRAPVDRARLMTAALGGANTLQATAALTDMLGESLPAEVRQAAHFALNVTETPSRDSVRALMAGIDDPEHGDTALLAAANQARKLDESEPELTGDVVELLVQRYHEAADPATRRLVVAALGNTGDVRIVPTLQHALGLGDVSVARAAAFALRHVPSAEADGLLDTLLVQHPSEMVRIEAVSAIGARDARHWAPRLEALLPTLGARVHLQAAMRRQLTRWGVDQAS